MFNIEIYQVKGSGKWKWKLRYNKQILARSENGYASPGAAKKAFGKMLTKTAAQFSKNYGLPISVAKV